MNYDEKNINGGSFQVARQIFESDIWTKKPDKWLKVWILILGKVNYSSNNQFKRGEGFFNSHQILANIKGLTPDALKKCMCWLKRCQMVSTTKSTRGIVIKVLNYDKYQLLNNYTSTTASTAKSTIEAPDEHQTSTTIKKKERKKESKRKNTPPIIPLAGDAASAADAGNIYSPATPPPKPTDADEDKFSTEEKIKTMFKSPDKRMSVIAYYWREKKFKFENKKQYQVALKRELKPSADLIAYSAGKIKTVVEFLKGQNKIDWTLETVIKFMNKDLDKIRKNYYDLNEVVLSDGTRAARRGGAWVDALNGKIINPTFYPELSGK